MPFGKIDVSCSGGAGDEAGREKELGHRRDEMLEHGLFPFPPGPLRTLSIGERQTSESRASPGGHPPGGALDDAQRVRAVIELRSGDRGVGRGVGASVVVGVGLGVIAGGAVGEAEGAKVAVLEDGEGSGWWLFGAT